MSVEVEVRVLLVMVVAMLDLSRWWQGWKRFGLSFWSFSWRTMIKLDILLSWGLKRGIGKRMGIFQSAFGLLPDQIPCGRILLSFQSADVLDQTSRKMWRVDIWNRAFNHWPDICSQRLWFRNKQILVFDILRQAFGRFDALGFME
jgi:hypothetical protein